MPLGVQEAAGIRFNILDPDKNNGRSCLVVRGSERQHFPAAIRDIKVGRKLSRLFFLHTAAWGGKGKAGAYRINFADGTHLDYPIEGNQNIGDWWTVAQLPAAKIGILRKNAMDHEVGTFVAEWENPKPDVEIRSIDFLSATEARGNEIDWLPSGTPIPVLVAVTGEKVSDKLLDITGSPFRAGRRPHGARQHGSGRGQNGENRQRRAARHQLQGIAAEGDPGGPDQLRQEGCGRGLPLSDLPGEKPGRRPSFRSFCRVRTGRRDCAAT